LDKDPTHGNWFSFSYFASRTILEIGNEYDFIFFTDARESFFTILKSDSQLRKKIIGTLHDSYFAAFRLNPLFYTKFYLDGFKRWGYYLFVNRIERWTYPRIGHLFSNTDYVKSVIEKAYRIPKYKINTVYIGLADHWRHVECKVKRKKHQLIFVGGNSQRKGIFQLAKAVALLGKKYPSLTVQVVGKDPNQAKIKKKIEKLGVLNRFEFIGFVKPDALKKLYCMSALMVMPSLLEAYGLVYLEALACGCIVIGSKKGGTKELFNAAADDFLVDPLDTYALVDKISFSLENREKVFYLQKECIDLHSIKNTVKGTFSIIFR
jgi:glycosyltransferase involved in cell wall biosynthesis